MAGRQQSVNTDHAVLRINAAVQARKGGNRLLTMDAIRPVRRPEADSAADQRRVDDERLTPDLSAGVCDCVNIEVRVPGHEQGDE